MKIFIPYRPSSGGLSSLGKEPIQQEDYSFKTANGNNNARHPNDDIYRCLKSLSKNSRYKHEAVICIDEDLKVRNDWISHLNLNNLDVTVFRCKNIQLTDPHERLPESLKQAILALAEDGDIIAWDLIADAIVCKNWDVQIIDCYKQFGNNYYYVPMFVEPRTEIGRSQLYEISIPNTIEQIKLCSPQTWQNIWGLWRNTIACHSLTIIPKLGRDYAKEEDFDEYVAEANKFDKAYIIENAGTRDYGYWSPMISSGSIFKSLLPRQSSESGSDLWLDNNFPMQKMVLCRSYVFHFHYKVVLDDIEVEHVNGY